VIMTAKFNDIDRQVQCKTTVRPHRAVAVLLRKGVDLEGVAASKLRRVGQAAPWVQEAAMPRRAEMFGAGMSQPRCMIEDEAAGHARYASDRHRLV
jgi:hypothetical protein